MRDILLALSLGVMFLYGFSVMTRIDGFLAEMEMYIAESGQGTDGEAVDETEEDML